MRALMPLSGFPSLRKEMERFFDRFGDWEFPELRALGEWTPSLDLSETREAFVEKAEQYYRMERGYGAFMRSVRLPAPVDGGKVAAAFKNGLLTVTLPKAPELKGTFIPIKT